MRPAVDAFLAGSLTGGCLVRACFAGSFFVDVFAGSGFACVGPGHMSAIGSKSK